MSLNFGPPSLLDRHSYARPDLVEVTHIKLDLFVNFNRTVLKGYAKLNIRKKVACEEIILDSYKLVIFNVICDGRTLDYNIIGDCDVLGSKFVISIPEPLSCYDILIEYETSPNSPALHWLRSDQTDAGTHPFLISNSKFTYARAIFPCQDTLTVKHTYNISISVPTNYVVLCSGEKLRVDEQPDRPDRHIHHFSERKETSSYTISFAVVMMDQEVLSNVGNHRAVLWAERSCMKRCRRALVSFEHMLSCIRSVFISRFFGIYDICVLPPCVPEFEAECHRVIYVSSTLFAGDDIYLWSKIIPIIVQNWSIMGLMFDEKIQTFLEIKGANDLRRMINIYGSNGSLEPLVPEFTSSHAPKDNMKYVPYEKGCLLLNYVFNCLETNHIACRKAYFGSYVDRFKYETVRTDLWLNHLKAYFNLHEVLGRINWSMWFQGLDVPFYESLPRLDILYRLYFPETVIEPHRIARQFLATENIVEGLISWLQNSNDIMKVEFLTYLNSLPDLPMDKMHFLIYNAFKSSEINEIWFYWVRLCIKMGLLEMAEERIGIACHNCMPKFAGPIFHDVYIRNRELAKSWFTKMERKMLAETRKEVAYIYQFLELMY